MVQVYIIVNNVGITISVRTFLALSNNVLNSHSCRLGSQASFFLGSDEIKSSKTFIR